MTTTKLVRGVSAGALAALTWGALATPAIAQQPPVGETAEPAEAEPAEQEGGFDVIVVTAQRREEDAQDVSISMTVLGGEDVSQHFRTTAEIAQAVPNIQLGSPSGFAIPRTGIRGVSQGDFNSNATTSNMIYIDDLAMNSTITQGVPIWDLDRVEVLRGPQGTLFGRNATGGAIRYISAMPTSEPSGYVDFSMGDNDMRQTRAAYGRALTDTLRGRLSYVSYDYAGDLYNAILRSREGQSSYSGIRGILEWTPTDDLTFTLRAQRFLGDQDVFSWKTTPGLTNSLGNFGPLANGFTSVADIQASFGFQNLGPPSNFTITESDISPNEHLEHIPISLNVDYDLGWAKLTSVSGYLTARRSLIIDNDATPASILNEYDRDFVRQWSQEVRLASQGEGPLTWIAGAFYMKERLKASYDFDATSWRGNQADLFPDADTVLYSRGSNNLTESYAAFLHTTYDITPDLKLTAAVRATNEEKSITYRFRSQWDFPTNVPRTIGQFHDFLRAVETGNKGTLLAAANPISASTTRSWDNVSWKLGLDYRINDTTLVYGLISRGFKGGAFTPTANTIDGVLAPDGSILAVNPEIVTDYEAGIKSDIIPDRLRVNASAFFYDYQDYQTNQLIPALAVQVLSNLPKAELYGAEFEVVAIPVDNLTVNLGLGLLHSEITESTDPSLVGNKLPLAEDMNWNAMVKYDFETEWGTITPEISAKHIGNYFGVKENPREMGDYTLLNARVGFESADGQFYGSIWGTNLDDTVVVIAQDDPDEFFGANLANVNQHRRYGITLGARF